MHCYSGGARRKRRCSHAHVMQLRALGAPLSGVRGARCSLSLCARGNSHHAHLLVHFALRIKERAHQRVPARILFTFIARNCRFCSASSPLFFCLCVCLWFWLGLSYCCGLFCSALVSPSALFSSRPLLCSRLILCSALVSSSAPLSSLPASVSRSSRANNIWRSRS